MYFNVILCDEDINYNILRKWKKMICGSQKCMNLKMYLSSALLTPIKGTVSAVEHNCSSILHMYYYTN